MPLPDVELVNSALEADSVADAAPVVVLAADSLPDATSDELDAAVLSAPPRLRIYNNMTNDGDRLQQNIKGMPVLLLDYLITTSLLLVTEVQEWLDRPQTVDGRVRIP